MRRSQKDVYDFMAICNTTKAKFATTSVVLPSMRHDEGTVLPGPNG